LIDSPGLNNFLDIKFILIIILFILLLFNIGHVDFSTEVSTAVRLCDGGVIIIDVCEGICPQTHSVLRQASVEKLKLILVLNKIDRLIIELNMTPFEAYVHLENLVGQFNAIVAQNFSNLLMEKKIDQMINENSNDDFDVKHL
jgi:ribosome assembly protein 1